MDKLFAIVIPYYKLSFFEDTLISLASQSDNRFTVYIGDDASKENPDALLKKYESDINYHYTRFENNLGATSLVKQWDRCLSLIGEEKWVMILGDDDTLDSNFVKSFHDNYNSFVDKTNVVRFSTVTIYEDLNQQSKPFKQPTWESPYDSYFRRITGENRSSLSEYIFKLSKYKKYGFVNYPLAWHSDDRAWFDFSEDLPIYSINSSRAYIRMSSVNISGREDNLTKKKQASLLFSRYLVQRKLNSFKEHQRSLIVSNYEKSYLKSSGFQIKHFLYLVYHYSKSLKFKSIVRLKFKTFKKLILFK